MCYMSPCSPSKESWCKLMTYIPLVESTTAWHESKVGGLIKFHMLQLMCNPTYHVHVRGKVKALIHRSLMRHRCRVLLSHLMGWRVRGLHGVLGGDLLVLREARCATWCYHEVWRPCCHVFHPVATTVASWRGRKGMDVGGIGYLSSFNFKTSNVCERNPCF